MEKKEEVIILSDPNAWCRLKSQKAKTNLKNAFLAHSIFFFLFFPSLSLNPVRKLGQAGAILSSPASTTLLSV